MDKSFGLNVIRLEEWDEERNLSSFSMVKRLSQNSYAIVFFIFNPNIRNQLSQVVHKYFEKINEAQFTSQSFETGLVYLNRIVTHFSSNNQKFETATAAMIDGNDFQLSQFGSGKFLLFRDDIFKDYTDTKDDVAKFESITTGRLSPGEWVAFVDYQTANALSNLSNEIWQNSNCDLTKSAISSLESEIKLMGLIFRLDYLSKLSTTVISRDLATNTALLKPKPSPINGRLSSISKKLTLLIQIGKKALRKIPRFTRLPILGSLRKPLVLIILVLLILLAYGVNLFIHRLKNEDKAEVSQSILDQVRNVPQSDIWSFLSSSLKNSNYQKLSDADKQEILNLAKQEQVIIWSSASPYIQIGDNGVALTRLQDNLAIVDNKGQTWQADKIKAEVIKQTRLIANPDKIIAQNNQVTASDTDGNIYLFDNTDSQPKNLALPNDLATGRKNIITYNKNLYLFSYDKNQIFKVANYNNDLSKSSLYLSLEKLSLTQFFDWDINGQIFITDQAGKITSINNKKVEQQTESGFNSPNISASPKGDFIAVSSKNFLKVYSVKLKELSRVIFLTENDNPITDLCFSSDGKNLFVLSASQIYQIPIQP